MHSVIDHTLIITAKINVIVDMILQTLYIHYPTTFNYGNYCILPYKKSRLPLRIDSNFFHCYSNISPIVNGIVNYLYIIELTCLFISLVKIKKQAYLLLINLFFILLFNFLTTWESRRSEPTPWRSLWPWWSRRIWWLWWKWRSRILA